MDGTLTTETESQDGWRLQRGVSQTKNRGNLKGPGHGLGSHKRVISLMIGDFIR